MKRFLCVVMIFMPLLLCAQKESGKKPEGLRRLEVSVSDNPVQGGRLEVTYLIEALDMNIPHPPVADGGRLVDVRASELKMKGRYYIREFTFVYDIHCNGWYRAIVIPSMKDSQLPFTSMITGICPMDPPQGNFKEVTLSKAGTLAQILSDEDKTEITSLKVNGRINGEDIALIRQMCGGTAADGHPGWTGSLMTLDLSDADMVSGGVYYTEIVDTQLPFIASKDVIGQFMFIDCHILRSIVLPRTVRFVDDYAFFGCTSLQHIDLGGARNNACTTAFRECYRLETPIPEV